MNLDSVTVADLEADPYPIYAELRDQAPVAYMRCLDVWMVTRCSDVEAALTNSRGFPARVADSPTDRALGGISMMTTDGEPAKRLRRPFDSTLRPRSVEASMPTVFERLCSEYLDALITDGSGDLLTGYFEPVSVLSLAHTIGLPERVDVAMLTRWFAGLAAGVSNYEDDEVKSVFCEVVSTEIDQVVRPLFEARFDDPDGSMISNLVHAVDGSLDGRIAWAMPSLKLVLLGGLQEPAHGGATIAHCLLSDREQLERVRADVALVPVAVEEGLRWTAPIGNLLRGVGPNTSIGSVELPTGSRAILVVSSANRDEEVWGPTADRFDISRPRRNHLSFAAGPHYCIGHHFARTQLRTAVRLLIDRIPQLRLDPDREVVYRGHEYRSPTSVPVLTH